MAQSSPLSQSITPLKELFVILLAVTLPSLVVKSEQSDIAVGAIRWDAWVGEVESYGLHGQASLSPQKWHSRIPFYSNVIGDNEVEIIATKQEIMDQEILYAAGGGLDYFAFLLYDDDPLSWGYALGKSLELYETSPFRDRLNFSVILPNPDNITADWNRWIDRFVAYFNDPAYQTVSGGRPLVYTFRWTPWADASAMIQAIRNECVAQGIANPYFVDLWYNIELNPNFDALSNYAVSDPNHTEGYFSYETLTGIATSRWQQRVDAGFKIVPNLTAGWNGQPRLEYPDDWDPAVTTYYLDRFDIPTPAQLVTHIQEGLDFVNANPVACESKALLIYAWNEFNEGGWLCPGLADYEGSARMYATASLLGGDFARQNTKAGTLKSWINQYYDTDNHEYVDNWDTDLDGMTTWEEYKARTDPTDYRSFYFSIQNVYPAANRQIDILWRSISTRDYAIYSSPSLDNPSWTPVITGLVGSSPMTTQRLPATSQAEFFQVVPWEAPEETLLYLDQFSDNGSMLVNEMISEEAGLSASFSVNSLSVGNISFTRGSNDGTFGNEQDGASVDSGPRNMGCLFDNGGNASVTISLNNNTGRPVRLNSFHYDAYRRGSSAGAGGWTLASSGNGITNTTVFTGAELPNISKYPTASGEDYTDLDVSLTGLNDRTLEQGENATLVLTLLDVSGSGQTWLDNIAIAVTVLSTTP